MSDRAGHQLRELLRRRHFVDRESGALLVWLPGDGGTTSELAQLAPAVEAEHPASRFTMEQSGAGLALRITAPDEELGTIEATYLD